MSRKDNTITRTLEECLASWNIKKAVEMTLSDDSALTALFELLRTGDNEIKLRALMVLEELLDSMPDVRKLALIRRFLDEILLVMERGNDEVSIHSLKVLAKLVHGVPLYPDTFIRLANALKNLAKSRRNEAVLLEIPPVIMNMKAVSYTPRLMDVLSRLLSSKNLRLKAMGLRLLLNTSVYTGATPLLKTVFFEVQDMLSEKDVALADFALDILLEISNFPLREEFIDDVVKTLTIVKNLALGKSPELREKAKLVAEKLGAAIKKYYARNPQKAMEKLHELLVHERFYEAVDLALAVGDTYILKWLAGVLEEMGKETLEINERVLPGPKYPEVPPEKKAQRYLQPPTLSRFRGKGRKAASSSLHTGASGQGKSTKRRREEFSRALASGDEEMLLELSRINPELVFELVRMLDEGDKFEKMDALWALSKLAEGLDSRWMSVLKIGVRPLINLALSRNRWMRMRAVKTLALLASRAPYGGEIVEQFLEFYLSQDVSKAIPALEFFGYYFDRKWDDKSAMAVLPVLAEYLDKDETRFDALLVLEALVRSSPSNRVALFRPFVEELKRIKKSAPYEDQKLAIRILEAITDKEKGLVHG
ncbi:hypothetical protein [Thermococcus aciditolerans]|uniref:Uncharacterized protein n=1 Tax=Thermococcus aciditolerans TaxID=2598455 RepID=A0A5C0SP79_9EURY|nr:hypothetical protein [Thermococcus aciditolerans]QEK14669.1 hypothetical protein FPV09_05685 [Thermococcus aciditolerans]